MPLKQDPILSVTDLHYQVGGNVILEDISFNVYPGEYVGIVGPNGAGKTTLLKLLLGLIRPTQGMIRIFGKPLNRAALTHIGYVPQRASESAVPLPTTVWEMVKSGRTAPRGLLRFFTPQDDRMTEKALEMTGLADLQDRPLDSLSGGQKQRVFIARALAAEPKLLILDEPTVGVDLAHQEIFYAFLRSLRETLGLTILFVTHDLNFVSKEVNCVLCINRKLVCHQGPAAFFSPENLEKIYGQNVKFISHSH